MNTEIQILIKLVDSVMKKLNEQDEIMKTMVVKEMPQILERIVVKRLSTTKRKLQENPDYEYVNPFNKDITIRNLSLKFDNLFRVRGKLLLYLGDAMILEIKDIGDVLYASNINFQYEHGVRFKKGDSLKFFIWNDVTDQSVGLTAIIRMGD